MLDYMDMAYVGFMLEEMSNKKNEVLNSIADDLKSINEPTNDDLEDICMRYGVKELSKEAMQYIGKKVNE